MPRARGDIFRSLSTEAAERENPLGLIPGGFHLVDAT
jgi:hypothetical protein